MQQEIAENEHLSSIMNKVHIGLYFHEGKSFSFLSGNQNCSLFKTHWTVFSAQGLVM